MLLEVNSTAPFPQNKNVGTSLHSTLVLSHNVVKSMAWSFLSQNVGQVLSQNVARSQ